MGLPRRELLSVAVLIAGYAAAALAVMVFARPDAPRAFVRALGIALGTFAFFMLAFFCVHVPLLACNSVNP